MFYETIQDAIAGGIATIATQLGADETFELDGSEGLVAFEVAGTNEVSSYYLSLVSYVTHIDPDGGTTYAADISYDPVLLTASGQADALDQIDVRSGPGRLQPNAGGDQTEHGFDGRYLINFPDVDGTERVIVHADLEDDRTLDLAVLDRDKDGRSTPNNDVLEVFDDAPTHGFKGDDVIVSYGGATIFGGSGGDIIQSIDGDDRINGQNDVIHGNQNDDTIYSGHGDDTVYGGTGDDLIVAGGDGRVAGGAGNDVLYAEQLADLFGGKGQDILYGGTHDYEQHVTTTLSGGDGADILYSNAYKSPFSSYYLGDVMFGGKSNDELYGGDGPDKMYGGTGDDLLEGGLANDTIKGGAGHDSIYGEDGKDYLYGGDGNDVIDAGQNIFDHLFGGNGNDVMYSGTESQYGNGSWSYGGSGNDTQFGVEDGGVRNDSPRDSLFGGKGDDTLHGLHGWDILNGGSGNDEMYGGTGSDDLSGGYGEDLIEGGEGDDTIRGGQDDDTLTGGDGTDRFGFADDGSMDVVTDFTVGEDLIELVDVADVASFEDLFLSQDDSTAVIQAGEAVIRLENTDVEDLDETAFLF